MTWISHNIISGTIAFVLTGNIAVGIVTATGSIFPDAVEGFPREGQENNWRKSHRQFSHWLPPYLAVLIASLLYAWWNGGLVSYQLSYKALLTVRLLPLCLCAFAFGCILHIVQDALSGTVPGLIDPSQRWGIRFVRLRSWEEYSLALSFLGLLFIALKVHWRGFLG